MSRRVATLDGAVEAYRAGDLARALALAASIAKRAPDDPGPNLLIARIALARGRPGEALASIGRVIAAHPDEAMAHYLRGLAHAMRGETAPAETSFARALEHRPDLVDAALELAALQREAGRLEAAAGVLRAAVAACPDHPALLCNLGLLLLEAERNSEGLALLARAQAMAPRSALIQLNAANGFKRCGAFEPALAAFDRVLALDPGLARAEHNRANLLLEMGRAEEALAGYLRSALLRRAPGATQESDASSFSHTTEAKLIHDLEQFAYLQLRGRPLAEHETVVAAHRAALAACRAAGPSGGVAFALPPDLRTALAPSYNRLLALDEGAKLSEGALDPAADYAGCTAAYEAGVGIAWLDGLLRPAALEALRAYCLGSTFWSTYRYANGYLGAFVENGFAAPLVGQIAEELAGRLPRIFAGHNLRKVWAFKYADGAQGIGIHADLAAINVNFWITPDRANRDPAHGGLVVWDREAPLDWDFQAYNKDAARIRAFLAESKAQAVRIPYRCNRAVIFNSDLFHETDRLDFAPGYANRRINITMLYGLRQERARRTGSWRQGAAGLDLS